MKQGTWCVVAFGVDQEIEVLRACMHPVLHCAYACCLYIVIEGYWFRNCVKLLYIRFHRFRLFSTVQFYAATGAEAGVAHDVALLRVDAQSVVDPAVTFDQCVAGLGFSIAPQVPRAGSMCTILGCATSSWFQMHDRQFEGHGIMESTAQLLSMTPDGCHCRKWAMEPGCSGGPMLDADGRLFAVLVGASTLLLSRAWCIFKLWCSTVQGGHHPAAVVTPPK
mmetsp:Transcript_11114/g.23962  ORF Transcript_11114/g.23962 Transcript_11114/m.23962 type:complete len:222 (+) Transcript_11114:386-1051(+)